MTTPIPPPPIKSKNNYIHINKQITPSTKSTQSKKLTVGLLISFPMFGRLSCQPAALQFNSDKSHQTPAQPPFLPRAKASEFAEMHQPDRSVSIVDRLRRVWFMWQKPGRSRRTSTTPISREMHKLCWFPESGRVETGFSYHTEPTKAAAQLII